jgi:phospholipase C
MKTLAWGPLGALLLACLTGGSSGACSSTSDATSAPTPDAGAVDDPRPPTPPEWDRVVTRPDEAQAAADRLACKFGRGALPDETLGASVPVAKDIPIDTIVVIMQENRSFDHYFGRFGKYAGRTDVESGADDATNPEKPSDPASPKHARKHGDHLCFSDTDHSWEASHTQYNDGKMDGFFVTNHGASPLQNGDRALTWYDERDIPYYYALAKEFGIGDHYHCSLLGPTWPNRMFLMAASSFGNTDNAFPDLSSYPFPSNDALILDELEKRHVDWTLFTSGGPPGVTTLVGPTLGVRWNRSVVGTLEEFYQQAAAGKLPAVSFFDANFLKEGDAEAEDEHPPGDIQIGQKLVSEVIGAVMKGPQWKRSAVFLTYDEHGGIYDHVPPPKACAPNDGKPTIDIKGKPVDGAFDRYGFRVPLIVVSPYAKRGYVSHELYDHSSVLRFIQAKFRVPALTSRDANASIPLDFFDFANPPHLEPPALPVPTIDDAELTYCKQTFAKK